MSLFPPQPPRLASSSSPPPAGGAEDAADTSFASNSSPAHSRIALKLKDTEIAKMRRERDDAQERIKSPI
jgi:hypothetical protein